MELPSAPHDMVTDALTQEELDDLKARGKIGEENPPLYISSMTYGRVLIYKITSKYSEELRNFCAICSLSRPDISLPISYTFYN